MCIYVCVCVCVFVCACVCVCVKRGPSEFADFKFTGVILRSILIFITRKFLINLSPRHGQLRR